MFEALFVLTTIDTGTRIGRFLVQELAGRVSPKLGETGWLPGTLLSTLFIVTGWSFFILTGSIATIWPMFGVANQLLASVALCVGTTIILREASDKRYAVVTLLPLAFVSTTTITAGVQAIRTLYLPMMAAPATATMGTVNVVFTSVLLVCVALVIGGSMRRWLTQAPRSGAAAAAGD